MITSLEQRKIEFEPRIKLNDNIHVYSQANYNKHGQQKKTRSYSLDKTHTLKLKLRFFNELK